MSINALTNNYSTWNLYNKLQDENNAEKNSSSSTNSSNSTSSAKNNSIMQGNNQNSAYATNSSTSLQDALAATLKAMGASANDRITLNEVNKYKANLEQEFSSSVRADLQKLGVDKDIQFQVVTDGSGGVKVLSDHEDKALVEKYFDDNPSKVKEFEKIQALGNLENVRKNQQMDPTALRKRIQVENMGAWFSDSPANTMMASQSSGSQFFTGFNTRV